MNNIEGKKKSLIILLIIFVLSLIGIIVYVAINKNNNTNNDDDIEEKQFYNTIGSEKKFTILSFEDYPHGDETYSKILIEFNNDTEIEAMMSQYFFKMVDENHKLVGYCYTASYGSFSEEKDIFPDIAPANQITKGYLYCSSSSKDAKYLNMAYLHHPIIEGSNDDVESSDYYFELKK